jgi:hypothetical protein
MRLLSITPGAYALCCAIVVSIPRVATSQGMGCNQLKRFAVVQGVDKVYASAQELAHELRRRGFSVNCILRSQWEGTFVGQAGAAAYRTDQGNFDALFLTPPETFDRLAVVERREGTRYVYSFEGQPKPWPANRIDSARPVYFVKDTHRLLVVGGDDVAARLRRALATRQPR